MSSLRGNVSAADGIRCWTMSYADSMSCAEELRGEVRTMSNVRGQHYTRSTVSASRYCRKCHKATAHRVDDGQLGPCLECIARLEVEHNDRPAIEPARQMELL
jgi:hypothetical protein